MKMSGRWIRIACLALAAEACTPKPKPVQAVPVAAPLVTRDAGAQGGAERVPVEAALDAATVASEVALVRAPVRLVLPTLRVQTAASQFGTEEEVEGGFAVCADGAIRPLGRILDERSVREEEWGTTEVVRIYEVPCARFDFVISGAGVRPGAFRRFELPERAAPLADFDGVTFRLLRQQDPSTHEGIVCSIEAGRVLQPIRGGSGLCRLLFAGDLNNDALADFLVETMVEDPCYTTSLFMSSDVGWAVTIAQISWCPD